MRQHQVSLVTAPLASSGILAPPIWPIIRTTPALIGTLCSGLILCWAASAGATTRSCSSNALLNTTNVLCSAPSGPCTSTQVPLNANIEVYSGSCTFDLGGRALTISKPFQITALGALVFENASSVTITATGKLKARGDFVEPNGYIIPGGSISLQSSGPITHDGIIDVSGDPAGVINLTAAEILSLEGGSIIQGLGITTFYNDAQRLSDGGEIDLVSLGSSITINGDVTATGTQQGEGGLISVQAARDVSVRRRLDASGGGSDGGSIFVVAGDNINVTSPLTVESRGGGGSGGYMDLEAGQDSVGGIVMGGGLTIDGAALILDGSAAGGFGGDGGSLYASAHGPMTLQGAGAAIRANAGPQYGGSGGDLTLETRDADDHAISPLDGDVTIGGQLLAQSSGDTGIGGSVFVEAGKSFSVNGTIDVSGKDSGGDLAVFTGGALFINTAVNAQARSSTGAGGLIELRAGSAQDAALTVSANINAYGGANAAASQLITLSGCSVTVGAGVQIDGHAGTSNGIAGGSPIQLIARHPLHLNSSSQYLAGPGGTVLTIHPPAQTPIIGSNVIFSASHLDETASGGVYEFCP